MTAPEAVIPDLATLDTAALCDLGAELELRHPGTNAPLGVYLTLAGLDSQSWRKAVSSLAEQRLAGRSRSHAPTRLPDFPVDPHESGIEILARCTLSWRHVQVDGKSLSCTLENARMLYRRFPWIFEQADRFASDRASYLRD